MNILYITPYLPIPDSHGCAVKNWDDLEELSKRHTIHVVCFVSEADKPKLSRLGSMANVCWYPVLIDSYLRRPSQSVQFTGYIRDLCENNRVDLLQCECSFMARYVPAGIKCPSVLTEHQVYWLHFWREWKLRKNPVLLARLLKNIVEERRWLSRFTRIVFFSEHDRDKFRFVIDNFEKTRIIPLAIDSVKYAPLPNAGIQYDLCFLGNFDSYANVDAVTYYIKKIVPAIKKYRVRVTTLIVGANIPGSLKRLAGSDVTCTGYVADVREQLASCKVFINPMRLGSGMRRKILEAWAMGKPVISTSIGAEGLNIRDGVNIILADTPQGFAAAIHALLSESQRMKSVAQAGRDTVLQLHGREKTAAMLEQVYQQVMVQ